ncbi:MAG: hypothetical protein RLZ81_1579 [Pseudomonadota bacterium]|jgi:aromatic ring hydroxylase
MAGIQDKIEAAEQRAKQAQQKLQQLKAQRDMIEARKLSKVLKGQRADDTRRKILAGSLVLDMMERDEATRKRFMDRLDQYLKRADDRALFDLPAKTEPGQSKTQD